MQLRLRFSRLPCLFALASFFVAVSLASVGQAGELDLSYGVGFTETTSDNVDLAPDGQEETALISDVIGNISLRSTSARVNANYDASATLRFQNGGNDEGYSLLPRLSGLSKVEAIEDLFFVDASSSISRQVLDSRAGDTESNRETVQTHRISPYLVNRFGGFASSELRYSVNKTITDDGSGGTGSAGDNRISDTTTQTASFSLNSGIDFSRLRWSINALASESDRSGDDTTSRRSVNLGTEYAVVRSFSLIESIGYERFEEEEGAGDAGLSNSDDFSGVTWRTGFRWRPSRRVDLSATYGRSDNDENFAGNLSYEIGSRTRITASYDERIETGEERLERNLSLIGLDPVTGELIDITTGLPFDPATGPTSVVSDVTRTKTFAANMSHTRDRDSFQFGTIYRTQEQEAQIVNSGKETGIGLNGSWSRRLNPRTNFRLQGSFQNTEYDDGIREDKEYSVRTGVDHNLFSNVNTFVNYSYRRQDSNLDSNEYVENRISAGARLNF